MSIFESLAKFREQLDAGHRLIGAAVTFSDPLVSEALAASVDFFWIDLEHGAMSPEALSAHLLVGRGRGIPCLVRVTGSATPWIKPVLDSGAAGIIVPQVETAEEVRRVVRDCRYPPEGNRGYGPRVPSDYGRFGGDDYVAEANRLLFVAVQIENTAALAAVDQIAAVPGLDSLVIGPCDLSAALGVMGQLQHPELLRAIDKIVRCARAAGKYVGAGMGPDPAYADLLAARGVQWLQVGGDYSYMIQRADQLVAAIRHQSEKVP